MRRKVLTFLVILVLLVAQFAAFVPCVYAQSTVATSTSRYSVSFPFQRKGFYAATRFWAFYGNNYEIYYESTTDPTVWSGSATDKATCLYGYDFSIFFDGTYVHCVRYYLYDLIYDRGTPYSNGTIIWTDSSYAYDGVAGFYYNYPCISVDSNGYAWIGARFYNSTNANRYPYVLKNAHNDGSWVTDFTYQLSVTPATTWYVQPVPLTSGKVYAIYCSEAALPNGKLYSGSWGSEETDLADYNNNYYGYMFCAVNEGDNVHFTYNRQTTYQIRYNKRTYGVGWGANDVLVNDTMESYSAPALTIDTTTGDLYCFWTRIDTDHVYYKKCTSGTWDASPTDWIDESTDDIQYGYMLNSYYQTYGGYTGLLYVTGLVSLYNVRFDYLTMAVSKAWYDVSTWTASLVTKTWSSGTSWTANLIARTWSTGTSWTENLQTRIWGDITKWTTNTTTSTFYITTGGNDGDMYGWNMSYSIAHDIAYFVDDYSDAVIAGQRKYGSFYSVYRTFLKFNTSTIPLGATVKSASLSLYGTYDLSNDDFIMNLQKWTGDTPITLDDFNQFDGVNYDDGNYNSSNYINNAYNTVTISNFDLIMKSGNTLICVRSSKDISSTVPTKNEMLRFCAFGTPYEEGHIPKLTVTWEEGGNIINLLTRQYLTVASWLFDFGTRIWVDAATWTFDWVTMAWENITWLFSLGTSIWTDIATWGANLVTMMWNDVATYGFNLLTMAWHDLTWLFTLLPALPEWVNVAVWIFHLAPAEWIFPFIWIIMVGFIGLCCLVLSAKPQKKRETENV